jgi:hypothetical protein
MTLPGLATHFPAVFLIEVGREVLIAALISGPALFAVLCMSRRKERSASMPQK